MEGRWADWGAYLEAMATKRTWIDTPVLIAASALFQCQIVCLLSSTPEPQLIASPTLTVSGDIPMFLMANVGNWHFFACALSTMVLVLALVLMPQPQWRNVRHAIFCCSLLKAMMTGQPCQARSAKMKWKCYVGSARTQWWIWKVQVLQRVLKTVMRE